MVEPTSRGRGYLASAQPRSIATTLWLSLVTASGAVAQGGKLPPELHTKIEDAGRGNRAGVRAGFW